MGPTLGILPSETDQRDAIHIAIVPAVACGRLYPGQAVGIITVDGAHRVHNAEPHIGIIDPFLKAPIWEGQLAWVLMFPNTITSLRHDWTHPAFLAVSRDEDGKAQSEKFIRDFASEIGWTYEHLIERAAHFVKTGDFELVSEDARDAWYSVCDEFWKHFAKLTAIDVSEVDGGFFGCSC